MDGNSLQPGDVDIPVEITNTAGETVADVKITAYISQRRSS